MPTTPYDVILVGGGLQAGLMALAIKHHHPRARLALIERGPRLGGNHLWCFHPRDVPQRALAWLQPLIVQRWPRYDVHFEGYSRRIESTYSAMTSDRLHEVVASVFEQDANSLLELGTEVTGLGLVSVTLLDGRSVEGALIVDARGPTPEIRPQAGYQKFLGQELELHGPHGLSCPVLMDARVDQSEGYRFAYVLPFSDRRLLVEDTHFSHSAGLDAGELRRCVDAYVSSQGWSVARVLREEQGVLPMPWSGSEPRRSLSPLVAGYAGGWFHPGTGYSVPVAARLAQTVALHLYSDLEAALESLAGSLQGQLRFARMLNRMLFGWFEAPQRVHVMSRFHRLPQETIERFYGLQLTARDRARIVLGRPPRGLSLRRALGRATS